MQDGNIPEPSPGKTALLGDQMVASLGNHRVFVFFRLAVVPQQTAMAGCRQQKGGQVSEEVTKGEECFDHGVIVGNEMEDSAPGRIRVPRSEQQHVGSLTARIHRRQRR